MDKFVPESPDILDRLYTDTEDKTSIGSLDDLLLLDLNENYKNNRNRSTTIYRMTEEQINIVQKNTK